MFTTQAARLFVRNIDGRLLPNLRKIFTSKLGGIYFFGHIPGILYSHIYQEYSNLLSANGKGMLNLRDINIPFVYIGGIF